MRVINLGKRKLDNTLSETLQKAKLTMTFQNEPKIGRKRQQTTPSGLGCCQCSWWGHDGSQGPREGTAHWCPRCRPAGPCQTWKTSWQPAQHPRWLCRTSHSLQQLPQQLNREVTQSFTVLMHGLCKVSKHLQMDLA